MEGAADGQQRGQWTGGGAAQKLSLKKNLLLMLRLESSANACSGFHRAARSHSCIIAVSLALRYSVLYPSVAVIKIQENITHC